MVKGLAKYGNCLRHDRWVKCVDVSLFEAKSGYSPMTPPFYRMSPAWSTHPAVFDDSPSFRNRGSLLSLTNVAIQPLDSSARNYLICKAPTCGLCGLRASSRERGRSEEWPGESGIWPGTGREADRGSPQASAGTPKNTRESARSGKKKGQQRTVDLLVLVVEYGAEPKSALGNRTDGCQCLHPYCGLCATPLSALANSHPHAASAVIFRRRLHKASEVDCTV